MEPKEVRNMIGRSRNLTGLLVAAGLAVSISACSGGSATPSVSPTTSAAVALPGVPGANPRQADSNYVELCKDYVGTPGPTVTFTIAVDISTDGTTGATSGGWAPFACVAATTVPPRGGAAGV